MKKITALLCSLVFLLAFPATIKASEAGRTVPHYNLAEDGGKWDGTQYHKKDGSLVTDAFFCDGEFTYYLQADGTPMKDKLTYHPDGEHLIYLDEYGHEVFTNFKYCKSVGYTCYFDVNGYLYKDEITFVGDKVYYLNKNGAMEQNGWFQFANGCDYGYANSDGTLTTGGFSYDPFGRVVFYHWNGMVARGLITDGVYYYHMDETDGHYLGQFPVEGALNQKQNDIRAFYQSHYFPLDRSNSADEYMVALNAINTVRYIAGLGSDVKINESYNQYAANGAYLNDRNGCLSHHPERPGGVDDITYELGYTGCSHSNLGMGHRNFTDSILRGYMEDSDSSNIDRVGHRRWVLSQNLQEVGMGASGRFSALMVIPDQGHLDLKAKQNICWPATNTPNQLFTGDTAWSVVLSDQYRMPERDSVNVTLVRTSDGATWTFNAATSGGNYFNVSNERYGSENAIIFRPDPASFSWSGNDSYRVTITGIKDKEGKETFYSYDVNFFTM